MAFPSIRSILSLSQSSVSHFHSAAMGKRPRFQWKFIAKTGILQQQNDEFICFDMYLFRNRFLNSNIHRKGYWKWNWEQSQMTNLQLLLAKLSSNRFVRDTLRWWDYFNMSYLLSLYFSGFKRIFPNVSLKSAPRYSVKINASTSRNAEEVMTHFKCSEEKEATLLSHPLLLKKNVTCASLAPISSIKSSEIWLLRWDKIIFLKSK